MTAGETIEAGTSPEPHPSPPSRVVGPAWSFIEGQRRRWIALAVLGCLASVMEAAAALLVVALLSMLTAGGGLEIPLVGSVQDRFPETPPDDLFVRVAIGIGAFFLVRAIVVLGQAFAQNHVAMSTGVSLSRRLLTSYMSMPYKDFLRRNSAEMIRNATESADSVARYVLLSMVALVAESMALLGLVVVLVASAPQQTLVVGVTLLPFAYLLLRVLQPRLAALGADAQDTAQLSIKTLQQAFGGMKDLRILGKEATADQQFTKVRTSFAHAHHLRLTMLEVPRIVLETLLVLFVLVMASLATLQDGSAEALLPVLGLFVYAVLRALPGLNRIIAHLNNLRFGAAAVGHIAADLHLGNLGASADASEIPFRHSITIQGVGFQYDADAPRVLSDIDLVIPAGSSVGFVGPTGGGKSTLVDVILGLLPPSDGRVLIDGQDLAGRERGWHKRIGVVPQSVFLTDESLRGNIALGVPPAEIDDVAIQAAVEASQLAEVIAELPEGLQTRVGERGVRLSGGQRQRVAIARALYRQPDVVVMDEGTSALDAHTEAAVMAGIRAQWRQTTLLMITHRLSTVEDCDQIVVLKDGRVDACGTFDELANTSPLFQRLASLGSEDARH